MLLKSVVTAATAAALLALPAVTAEAATGTVTTAGAALTVRSAPSTSAAAVRTLARGAKVNIICQTTGTTVAGKLGTSNIWDKIGEGQYVSDTYVQTGSDKMVAPPCSTPRPPVTGPKRTWGKTLPRNPFNSYWCTYGADYFWHAYNGTYLNVTGDARLWGGQAKAGGWTVTTVPYVNSVVVFPRISATKRPYGHVAWVKKVEKVGSTYYITVDEKNYPSGGRWNYNRRVAHTAGNQYILAPHK